MLPTGQENDSDLTKWLSICMGTHFEPDWWLHDPREKQHLETWKCSLFKYPIVLIIGNTEFVDTPIKHKPISIGEIESTCSIFPPAHCLDNILLFYKNLHEILCILPGILCRHKDLSMFQMHIFLIYRFIGHVFVLSFKKNQRTIMLLNLKMCENWIIACRFAY